MSKKKITVFECDNPRCLKIVIPDDGVALGFHVGRVTQHADWGGRQAPQTFACSADCLIAAIEANLARSEGRDPLTGDWAEDG